MRKLTILVIASALSFAVIPEELSDTEIRQILINQSIQSYSGSCPCPYNRAETGVAAEAEVHTAGPVAHHRCAMTATLRMRW